MSINFNVSHISYRFYCDKLSSIDLSKNLIIESSANNIEFKSNNRNISFNNSTVLNSGLNMNDKDLSNIHTIRGNILNIDTLFLKDISNSLANIVDDNFIEDGYIRGTTIGYNPAEPNIISARDGYFTYIDVSGGDSSFNNSVYIKNSLGVSGTTTISNDLIVNGTSYVTLYNAINNYITNIRQDLSSAKIVTKDLSASNISISNELVVAKTSFINDLSISGHYVNNILKVPHDFTIDPSGHDNASGTLIINGDLIVYGNRTTIGSSIVEISDITLSVATNLTISNDLYRNEAGLDISNVASIKYDGTNWNFNGGQLSVENKIVSFDASLIALKNSVGASLSILNSSFDLSYSQLKNNNDNSFNNVYTKSQIDASFILKPVFDVSLDNFKFYVDNSYIKNTTFDASFNALKTYLDASYILKGTIINPNVIDSSLNFLRNKLDLSFVLKSVFDASYNNLKSQIDASFASVRLTSLDTPSISVDAINTKHSSGQTFNNTLWNQLGLDISNGPPLTNNNNNIAISNDGRVVAMASSSHSDISKGRVYVYELSYNQASYNWRQLGLSSEIIVGVSNNDEFGWDIALSSNGRVVAGSSINSDASGINCGQVRLFELSNNVWRQKGLNINGPRAGSESGYSISLAGNGNSIAIGAWKDSSNGTNAGAVRVYDFSASINDWRQKGQTIAGVSGSFEGYVTALSLDGQTLASGRIDHINSIVKIFSWSGTTWAPKGTIQGPDISNSYFGRSIKLSANGNAIVIGAPGYTNEYRIPPVYEYNSTVMNWQSHRDNAITVYGRDLAVILDASQNAQLNSLRNNTLAYIGGRRRSSSSNPSGKTSTDWEWVTGDVWNYENFASGEPNTLDEKAVHFWTSDGKWNDINSASNYPAIYMYYKARVLSIGQAYVYGYVGGTTWSQLGQTLVGISGGNEFGSSVAISNDGTIISVGTNDISSNRGYVNVYKYVDNYWRQISNTLNGKVLSFKAGLNALSGDGTTLFQSNNNYYTVYGINKILALNSPITSISGNLIVIGATSVNSLDISRNHSYSTNGYSYKVFDPSLGTAIMKEYYSDVSSTRFLKVQILGNGNINNRNNSYSSLSDSRLKENIVSTSPKLEDLLKVRVVNYNLKGSDNSTYIGVLAQELEELFPNLVTELEPSPKDIQDGNTIKYKTVNYSCFDSLLIKSLQEQNAILKNIEKRIIALEEKLDDE